MSCRFRRRNRGVYIYRSDRWKNGSGVTVLPSERPYWECRAAYGMRSIIEKVFLGGVESVE